MEFYFVPPDERAPDPDHDDDGHGRGTLPQALLDRHGARVLHPSSAPVAAGWPVPRRTVYRARTLLVPPKLLLKDPLDHLNDVLERVGMQLVPVEVDPNPAEGPEPVGDREQGANQEPQDNQEPDDDPVRDDEPDLVDDPELAGLPTVAVLLPVRRGGRAPAVVDAWTALTTLREAAGVVPGDYRGGDGDGNGNGGGHNGGNGNGDRRSEATGRDQPDLRDHHLAKISKDVAQISLEHLLVGAVITGSPEIEGSTHA